MPEGFYNSIKQRTMTFLDTKKAIKVRDNAVIDQETIYARVIGLIVSQRELDLTDVVSCELAAYPLQCSTLIEACKLLLIKHVWRTAMPLKPLLGMGRALCYCCGCLSSSVDITLAPTRYCPNINLYFQDVGWKQIQQFGRPSGTVQVLWLLCQEQHKGSSCKQENPN